MSRMNSKYPGTCARCNTGFPAGTVIVYNRRAPRGRKAEHTDCENPEMGSLEPARDFEPVSNVIRTSGGTFYRNRAGTCEDAPCCGCCTI